MSDQQEQCNHAPHMLKKLGVGDFPYECSGCGHKFTLLLAATESKAEGGATAREYGVFGHVCLCLHHRADHANYTDGCNNCSCAKFIHYHSAEPPQPSVQPMEIKLTPVEKMVSHGDRIHFAHEKCGECVEPSVQGEQDDAQPPTYNSALESLLYATKRLSTGKPVRNLDEIIAFAESALKAPVPSITSARIAEIVQEIENLIYEKFGCELGEAIIQNGIEKALREAGVRVK